MKTVFYLALLIGFASLSISSASAQNSEQVRRFPEGGTRQTLVSISIPPLLNAPFTATVTTVWTTHMADGATATIMNHRTVARDSAGRIFQERRYLAPGGDKQRTALSQLEFSDPSSHEQYICDPNGRVCERYDYYALASAVDTASGASAPEGSDLKSEDLGHEVILGLDTIGTRETTTIPPGTLGNDQPLAAVREFWHSTQLGFNLVLNRTDPRSGSADIRVTDIHLGEPDAKLFSPPSDYTIVDARRPATPSSK
jgi:hypothetical protein